MFDISSRQMMETDMLNKYKGTLLGLAAGDALGTTLEFTKPGTFAPISDMAGGGPFQLQPGEWTDDTSMALCLAASLIEKGCFDPHDQMARYVQWYRNGYMSSTGRCFDIGNTTRDALEKFLSTNDPYGGDTDPRSAGNGSLMRLAPVPMYFINHPSLTEYCGESSLTTHAAVEAVDACRYFGLLIARALQGTAKTDLLAPGIRPQGRPIAPAIAEIADGSYKVKSPPQIQGSGYVVRSLEAALWAFYTTTSFKDSVLAAVNLGDDADTTGAICGQIAGAFYGLEEIPDEWVAKIVYHDLIIKMATQLYLASQSC